MTGLTYVLSIAGFDPSGGAGVLADIKTLEQLGVYGMAVCTAITFQTEDNYLGTHWLPWQEIEAQLQPILAQYHFSAIKIGLVENIAVLNKLLSLLRVHFSQVPIIWDPILKASAGHVFHAEIDHDLLVEVLGSVTVLTPNWEEAKQLSGRTDGLEGAKSLALYTHIYLKGGHKREGKGTDFLLTREGETHLYVPESDRVFAKHGSGCVFSAALAAHLARNYTLQEAGRKAKDYTFHFLNSSPSLLGTHATWHQK